MLDAAKAMKLSAKDLLELHIIDEIVKEPVGGAHREKDLMLETLKNSIEKNLDLFLSMSSDEIVNQRKNKFLKIGRTKGFIDNLDVLSNLKETESNYKIFKSKKVLKILSILGLTALILTMILL